jgi:hypothetical protein
MIYQLKRWYRIWRCQLFHTQKDHLYNKRFIGCRECDVWRLVQH